MARPSQPCKAAVHRDTICTIFLQALIANSKPDDAQIKPPVDA